MAIERDLAELEAACAYWQKALRLEDWRVYVRWDDFELVKSGRAAKVEWRLCHKTALIDVLVPELYPEAWHDDERDFNTHLVHELLHLHTASFAPEDGTAEDAAHEQAIHLISEALARLKRDADAMKSDIRQPRTIMLPPTQDDAERERLREAAIAILNAGANDNNSD